MAQDLAAAHPTKAFFVSMLIRNINLVDAILDLVDNCLDGVTRDSDGADPIPYQNYRVSIEAA